MNKIFHHLKKNHGFSVVEMVIAIAISAIIFIAAYNLYFSFYNNWTNAKQDSSIIDDLNFVEFVLSKDIRSAVPPSSNHYSIEIIDSDENLVSNSNLMRLYKNVSDSNKMIEIEYELNNSGSLLRKINTSTNDSYPYIFDDTWDNVRTITSDIEIENIFTDLNLADTNNQRYIKVDLTITRNNRSETLEFELVSRSRGK